jgi:hypothetical protein
MEGGLSPDLRQMQMAGLLLLEGTYRNWKLSGRMSNCKNRAVGRKLLILVKHQSFKKTGNIIGSRMQALSSETAC